MHTLVRNTYDTSLSEFTSYTSGGSNTGTASVMYEQLQLIFLNNPEQSSGGVLLNSVLKNFAKFKGKHLCQTLFLKKVAGLKPQACSFIKKRLWHRCFSMNFEKC